MRTIDCINGLEYDKVMFRNEIANLIGHLIMIPSNIKIKVDYIKSIDIDLMGGYLIQYVSYGKDLSYYSKGDSVARRINEFSKIEQRDYKLNELGI